MCNLIGCEKFIEDHDIESEDFDKGKKSDVNSWVVNTRKTPENQESSTEKGVHEGQNASIDANSCTNDDQSLEVDGVSSARGK